jgi:hypothetical protein
VGSDQFVQMLVPDASAFGGVLKIFGCTHPSWAVDLKHYSDMFLQEDESL